MTELAKNEMTLEKRIQREIMSFSGVMGIYASDLRGRVISIADQSFETASTIKSYILAVLFHKVQTGEKNLGDLLAFTAENAVNGSGLLRSLELGTQLSVKNLATLMIIISDNVATNMLIEYLGLEEINRCIESMGFSATKLHCKIGGENWARLGTTTPSDYGRLFERIATGTLTGPEGDGEMLEILKGQHYNSLLANALPPYYLDSDNYKDEEIFSLASKGGSINACRNDGGIMVTPFGNYAMTISLFLYFNGVRSHYSKNKIIALIEYSVFFKINLKF